MALPVVFFVAVMAVRTAPFPINEAGLARLAPPPPAYTFNSRDPAVHRAAELLNVSRPAQALQQLQAALPRHPRDSKVLLLAGLAAYRADDVATALGYWKQSLDLAPNQALDEIYQDALREAAADRNTDKLFGDHIALRFENGTVSRQLASAILITLDDAFARVSSQLGCTSDEPIPAIVRSRESYLRITNAADWSGGQYDGRVEIAWPNGEGIDPQIQRALTHELVHACLMSIPSGSAPWPAWLQEGLAQKLSGDTLDPVVLDTLRQLAASHAVPRLEDLGEDWSSMSKQKATAAYDLALAAADTLYESYSVRGIHGLLANPGLLPAITSALDAQLGL